MKLILLSGGSGKRLWPLSNDSRSKQFLDVLKNSNNQMESMVQRVWKQLKRVGLDKNTYITTSKDHVDIIQRQLGKDVPIIIESTRRDTFPAIVLASSYLFSEVKMDLDEVVCVLPVDPYVDDLFFERLKELEEAIDRSNADIALMGVNPTYPSEKYGYIVPKQKIQSNDYFDVSHFVEKPIEEHALNLIKQNALWNCGIFAFRLNYIINKMNQDNIEKNFQKLLLQYDKLPKNSFDYEVVEKAKNIISISYNGYWKDLGTWNTLTDTMSTNRIGNAIISNDSVNTHVINELEIPLVVIGLSNIVVATSFDGILVTEKSKSHLIKDLAKDFNSKPMYKEFYWGSYKTLDYTVTSNDEEVLIRRIQIFADKKLPFKKYFKRELTWNVIVGDGYLIIDDVEKVIRTGEIIEIAAGTKFAVISNNLLEIIEIQKGTQLMDEEIESEIT